MITFIQRLHLLVVPHEKRAFSIFLLLGCSWACFTTLAYQAHEARWYPLHDAMAFTVHPPYRHRILFVLLANFAKALFPTLSDTQGFLLSQIPPIVLTFHFIKKWGELFVGESQAFIGQLLLVVMIGTTFRYYTFYDIGVVLFFTICLICLAKRRYLAYSLFLALGTFNHESTLFLGSSQNSVMTRVWT